MNSRAFLLLIVGLILHSIAWAQHTWQLSGPQNFTGIRKLSEQRMIACNDAGYVFISSDQGQTWNSSNAGSRKNLFCLSFADSENGILGADSGYILKTANGGSGWETLYCGIPLDVIAVAYPAKDTIFIALRDGTCLRSFTGGMNWDTLEIRRQNFECRVVELVFPTSTYGYAAGRNSALFRTTNAGTTWSDRTPIFHDTLITSIDATIDGKVAYATANGHTSCTLDGVNWKGLGFSALDTLNYPIDVIKIHNDTIFIFQKKNKYRITRTFGAKWWATRLTPASEIQNPTYSINPGLSFNDMYFDDNTGEGIAVGTWGTMYKLSNYGATGEFLHHCNIGNATTSDWVHIQSLESNPDILHAIAHRGNQFAHSSDGGATWLTRIEKNYGFSSYMGLHFSNDSTGIIFTASRKQAVASGFLNTTDNGASWKYEAESIQDNMYSVGMSATGKLYITADSTIYRSLDNGYTWDTLWSFGISSFDTSLHQVRFMIRSASFLNDDKDIFLEVWAMDSVLTNPVDGGRITHSLVLASTDGGTSWEKRHSFPLTHTLSGMRFITRELGYALTYFTAVKDSAQSTCWQTTDGGYTWKPLLELERSWTPLVFGKNGKYGILASSIGSDIYVTTDSGYTWQQDSIIYPEKVKFVLSHFIDDSTAMLTSNVGFWRKSFGAIKSGVEWKKATSNPYLFIYTYPSPATGSILRCRVDGLFSITDPESIVLKMYDLLGREILDLSHHVQKRNDRYSTEFEFSLQGVPKGVYTLVLTTSNGGAARNIVVIN